MITRRSFSIGGVLGGLSVGTVSALAQALPGRFDLPADAEIREILAARVGALSGGRDVLGMVGGVIGPGRLSVVSVGRRGAGDVHPLSGDTAFEFGSVTKVFTALLLAEMVLTGEVSLEAPASMYLPRSVRLPERHGRFITLADLATHTSGLPLMPELAMPDSGSSVSPNAANLYAFLADYKTSRDIGRDWEYSNLGYWLLGEALAARARVSFGSLLSSRVLAPLGMKRSGLTLSPDMRSDLAIGHDSSLRPSPSISDMPVYNLMPAAGLGFYSTANDALSFLSAAVGYANSPLAPAIALTVDTRRPISGSADVQALGWTLIGSGDDRIVFRDGGTFGFASCLAWDRTRRLGVVVLANCVADVSDIARHVLRPDYPLTKPSVNTHTEVAVDPAVLARYVGRYEARSEGVFTIGLDDGHLTIQAPAAWGLPKLRIRPENGHDFFAAELPLRVIFQTSASGTAIGMTIYPPRGQAGVAALKIG